ncbi:unnamed protein product [Wickerhamomyces anomalus]
MSSQLALRRALVSARSMRVGVRAYTEGATGSNRPESSGDSFTKREKANEDYYVRKHEQEQLTALKESLKKQKENIADLEEKM